MLLLTNQDEHCNGYMHDLYIYIWVGNKVDLRLTYRFLLFRGKRFHFYLLHNF